MDVARRQSAREGAYVGHPLLAGRRALADPLDVLAFEKTAATKGAQLRHEKSAIKFDLQKERDKVLFL